jgi:hypothetical protein
LLYTAYFDESDTHGPSPTVLMACFLGSARGLKSEVKHRFGIDLLGTHTVAKKETSPPLMMSDFLAYSYLLVRTSKRGGPRSLCGRCSDAAEAGGGPNVLGTWSGFFAALKKRNSRRIDRKPRMPGEHGEMQKSYQFLSLRRSGSTHFSPMPRRAWPSVLLVLPGRRGCLGR